MVRRLVQQQHVGLFKHQRAQRHATNFAAAKRADGAVFINFKSEILQHLLDLIIDLPAVLGLDKFNQFVLARQKLLVFGLRGDFARDRVVFAKGGVNFS